MLFNFNPLSLLSVDKDIFSVVFLGYELIGIVGSLYNFLVFTSVFLTMFVTVGSLLPKQLVQKIS